jgi:hypothetical protein
VRSALAAVALAAVATAPATARAASCGKPDLVDMVPPDAATGVPLNARLGAHYAAAAEYLGEDVVLVHPDSSEEILAATWDATEQFLTVTPTAPLLANSQYEIRWPPLRGLNAAAPGLGGDAKFMTGAGDDLAPPSFVGVTGLTWDLERVTDECTDEQVERFVFDLSLGAASDDGGTTGLTLMLYQTKGPHVGDTPTPIPARAWPQDGTQAGKQAQVRLATDVAVGEICFAGIVRDTTGAVSSSGDVEACVHTTDPPFFRGCSVARGGVRGGDLLASAALVALLLRRRTRRR